MDGWMDEGKRWLMVADGHGGPYLRGHFLNPGALTACKAICGRGHAPRGAHAR